MNPLKSAVIPDVDHEQDHAVVERARDPERQRDLEDPEHELKPPDLELILGHEGDGQVDDALEQQEEGDQPASVVNAACGWTTAQMPTAMKSTPRIPRTILQPEVETRHARRTR